jgi:superfamily II DNA/RNA helicase
MSALCVGAQISGACLRCPTVPQVVHYNVPPSVDAYVHRSGRTARAAADGVSLCLIGNCTRSSAAMPWFTGIQDPMNSGSGR